MVHVGAEDEDTLMQSDASTLSGEEEGEEKYDSSDEEHNSIDPWTEIVNKALQRFQPEYEQEVRYLARTEGMDLQSAKERAFRDMRPKYRKVMADDLLEKIDWMNALQRNSTYKSLQETARDLQLVDDYDSEEAWKYAVHKRKYLLEKILREYEPPNVILATDRVQGQNGGSSVVEGIQEWADHEVERIRNAPKVQIIGRKD